MKGKRILVGLALSSYMITASAQQEKKSFEEYRKGVLEHYNAHRKAVLDGYSEYLNGVWQAYQSFRGEVANKLPKPERQPLVESAPKSGAPVMWQPDVVSPAHATLSEDATAPLKSFSNMPTAKKEIYTFYGLEIELPRIEAVKELTSCASKDIASYWKNLQEQHVGFNWISEMKAVTSSYGFNDWLKIDFVRQSVNRKFSELTANSRLALTHFILVHLGYNIRLGITNANRIVLLIPFSQMVYARTFVKLHDTRYYIYYDGWQEEEEKPVVSTYEIPETVNNGKVVDLIFRNPIVLPINGSKEFHITDGRLIIEGTVSTILMKMLSRYPQMPVSCYAMSNLQQELRGRIVEQIKQQVKGMNELDAVNAILRFVQYGFQYATDGQQFGYEKPFFMEELLYYPQCDCEDRAVFYAYLVRHVLALDCHLIKFPGHECVAVKLSQPIEGSGYMYKDGYYFISDPTYIGASTGMCMPDYLQEQPVVECW